MASWGWTKTLSQPGSSERFTGFYACSCCGWWNHGGKCPRGHMLVPVYRPVKGNQ